METDTFLKKRRVNKNKCNEVSEPSTKTPEKPIHKPIDEEIVSI